MNNPEFIIFLPYFYLSWSDDILTKKEFETLSLFISSRPWLNKNEKEFLLSKINLAAPPSRSELSEWKSVIEEKIASSKSITTVFDLILSLSEKNDKLASFKFQFEELENNLGILSEEVINSFKESHTTITSEYGNVTEFDVAILTSILDGEQAAIINKVKEVISTPEFEYETSTDILVYREKVLEWCKILAKENLGNMAYPKYYG